MSSSENSPLSNLLKIGRAAQTENRAGLGSDILSKISDALNIISSVRAALLNKQAQPEIQKIFLSLSELLTAEQLSKDDRYFLRGLARLELGALLLVEKKFIDESLFIEEAARLLRRVYVDRVKQCGIPLDGNKICVEFCQLDTAACMLDIRTLRRIKSILLAVGLSGRNYFFNGMKNIKSEEIVSLSSLEEHARFIRDSYYRLNIVRHGIESLIKEDRADNEAFWRMVVYLMPEGSAPITLDYRNPEIDLKYSLVGLGAYANSIAGLVMISEILRTHPSTMFGLLGESFFSMAQSLIYVFNSYCSSLEALSANSSNAALDAQRLKKQLLLPVLEALTLLHDKISRNPEFKPQLESLTRGVFQKRAALSGNAIYV